MRLLDWIDRGIRGIGVVTAWLTVVSIAAYGALQMLDRKLQLGVSSYLPDLSTSLLFILIFMTFGYTYLRDGHVRVDVLRRHWSARRIAWVEIIGGLFVLLPLAAILTYYGWDGLMRTTKFAETQVWAQRIAGVVGPILLALAGVIVVLRNIAFLAGKRAKGVWQLSIRATRSDRFGMLHKWSLIARPQEELLTSISEPPQFDGPQPSDAHDAQFPPRQPESASRRPEPQRDAAVDWARGLSRNELERLPPEKRAYAEKARSGERGNKGSDEEERRKAIERYKAWIQSQKSKDGKKPSKDDKNKERDKPRTR